MSYRVVEVEPVPVVKRRHETRFIIEYKSADGKWYRSTELPGFYATRIEAQSALDAKTPNSLNYHVRQK